MEDLFNLGKLRLQPASFFSRPELNQAVRDDELSLPLSFSLTKQQLKALVANPQDVPESVSEHRLDIEFSSSADFWMYCVTQSVEPRLVVDFEAEACVLVRHRDEFRKRLIESARDATSNATMREGAAIYVDPLLPKTPKIFVPLSKPFGYSYQDEYRFCWLPEPANPRLGPLDICIGSIDDIAELIVL
ncbi:hypothetical protein EN852_001585 [Mesorhizobium sp. M2E.F.Ca.ET.209.01.1.1]|uniref:hypothetical protein n=1 Tax=Mesorhizobium sp. M2E.F.Ca.ET.209.01.1.1 TaxID=2500526 RepID=UPI000FDBC3AD|nr:hypothetical protein [Mesorhizobium sp. M2E.F.Ca.ET.209.01.1.1]TGS19043.1 hypothetical protein EN852_001585 [Mesorhizobium sp. M2E.F.Ca.ET.209.01.1.1]